MKEIDKIYITSLLGSVFRMTVGVMFAALALAGSNSLTGICSFSLRTLSVSLITCSCITLLFAVKNYYEYERVRALYLKLVA